MSKAKILLLSSVMLMSCGVLFPPHDNPANCTIPGHACGDEEVCDTTKQMCVPKRLNCTDSSACDFSVPACPATTHVCTPCYSDIECKSWSMTHNMLAGSGQAPKFNYCKTAQCHECSPDVTDTPEGSLHCPDPLAKICDKASLTCRGCVSDGDCNSGICRKLGDYPETAPVAGLLTGQCVAAADIAYASSNAAGCNNTMGTKSAPFCTVDKAIMSGKKYISLQGGNYPALTVTGGNVVITGTGRDASTPAVFPSINLTGAGMLTLSGLQVSSAPGIAAAISCRGSSTLYVRDVAILKAPGGRGIDAEQDCAKVFVDRVRINATTNYGIIVGGSGSAMTVQYSITNTAVTASGVNVGVEEHGVYFGSKSSTTGFFAFNTVANSCYRGVGCQAVRAISDSIVQGNQASQVDACSITRVVQSGAELESGAEPKLKTPSTANDSCCVDKGVMPAGQIMVPTDFYGVSRPQGQGFDIGYHELQ